ncbi:MAG: 2-dehydropantoate 2-reductase [Verrucomicrobiota bacterium]|nr:2-dehydropantoate 2-reductase [Verrucomicrobiota bacterium]
MKIAIVGPGAVGSYYGAKLLRFGQEVHFLLRSDYDAVRKSGVRIISPEGNFSVRPRCAKTPEEIGVCDLVIISLKTVANDRFNELLPPLTGPQTALLTLQNGLGNEEALSAIFGSDNVLGGLCFVCLNRLQPGVIEHLVHGKITLGEFNRWPEPRTHDLATMFRNSGIPCAVTDNLARARWEKLIWNIPFNGLGVASAAGLEAVMNGKLIPGRPWSAGLSTDLLLADAQWLQLIRDLMHEIKTTANALNLGISDSLPEELISLTRAMKAYKPSTLLDFEKKQPLELQSIFLTPLDIARRHHVSTPRLQRLCTVLEGINNSIEAQNALSNS